jgi:S-phase kinase-associated protein 1
MEKSEKVIVLTARDWDEKIIIDEKTANVSGTIKGMMEASVEESNGSNMYPILIDCPHADVLEKVMEWAKHHKVQYDLPNNEVPRSDDEYSVWDLMYFNVSDNTLLKILVVSNYLEMTDLFRQSITMLRHRLRSQTEDQLRRRAGAYGEEGQLFDEDELAQVKRENAMVKLGK